MNRQIRELAKTNLGLFLPDHQFTQLLVKIADHFKIPHAHSRLGKKLKPTLLRALQGRPFEMPLPTIQEIRRMGVKPKRQRSNKLQARQVENDKVTAFYKSYEWRRLRYTIIKQYGPTCMACGATNKVIHVDHIKPLRKYWHLRLESTNLQVLCEECNHGKGNWDETDFRPKKRKIPRVPREEPVVNPQSGVLIIDGEEVKFH